MANRRSDRRKIRRDEAEARAVERASRSKSDQLELLAQRPGESLREFDKLAA